MKKVVPFTKTITFKTMIAEITDIALGHTLKLTSNNEVEGDIIVDGKYKMTDASQIEEEFHYELPFTISIDDKYDTENLEIAISDFYFEIINEEDLKINVEITLDGLEEKEVDVIATKITLDEVENLEELELVRNDNYDMEIPVEIEDSKEKLEFVDEGPLDKLAKEIEKDLKEEDTPIIEVEAVKENDMPKTSVSSIFSSLAANEETFSTYYVYNVRESDTLEYIMDKYKTTKEELENYNDLTEIKIGSKLIIPCSHE